MFKLIKYEWMNRWKFFLGGALVYILLNVDVLRRIINEDQSPSFFTMTLFLIGFAGVLIFIFDHIRRMYKSLFTEEGPFLFAIPLNGYKILGSKILTILFECLAVLLFAGIIGFIDYKVVAHKFSEMMIPLTMPQDFWIFAIKVFVLSLSGYMIFILTVYLAMALVKSIFYSVKYGKILSFIFFILISMIEEKVTSWIDYVIDSPYLYEGGMNANIIPNEYVLLNIGMMGILFVLTGYLLDRRINL